MESTAERWLAPFYVPWSQHIQSYDELQSRYADMLAADGSDSFTIIGVPGIGKSAAISRSMDLLNQMEWPCGKQIFQRIIPCMEVQCSFDASPKALLLEILRIIDVHLGSTFRPSLRRQIACL